jgi:hypothetical protein
MKRLAFLVTGIFLCLGAAAQVDVSGVYTATPPSGATKLTGQELKTYLHSNFKVTLVPTNNDFTYQADGVVICSWSLKANPQYVQPLDTMHARIVRGARKNATINSERIETINKVRFSICDYQHDEDGEGYIRFMSEFNKNLQNMNGILQFKVADKDKAHQYLKDLLESLKFKE